MNDNYDNPDDAVDEVLMLAEDIDPELALQELDQIAHVLPRLADKAYAARRFFERTAQ